MPSARDALLKVFILAPIGMLRSISFNKYWPYNSEILAANSTTSFDFNV
jgi:hypothetical protein